MRERNAIFVLAPRLGNYFSINYQYTKLFVVTRVESADGYLTSVIALQEHTRRVPRLEHLTSILPVNGQINIAWRFQKIPPSPEKLRNNHFPHYLRNPIWNLNIHPPTHPWRR